MQWELKTYIEDKLSLGPSGLARVFQFILGKLKKVRKTPGFSKAGNSGWLVIQTVCEALESSDSEISSSCVETKSHSWQQ